MLHRNLPPQWQAQASLLRNTLSPYLASWLFDSSSTTKRFRHEYHSHFQIHLLQQTWQPIQHHEKKLLRLYSNQKCLTRETALLHQNKIWMYARTIFPCTSLIDKGKEFKNLGKQSLGTILQQDRLLKRSPFEFALLRPGHFDYHRAIQNLIAPPQQLWARRSIFHFYQKPILLTEVFFDPWHTYHAN
jgi:chorismate--pyruvate lyase